MAITEITTKSIANSTIATEDIADTAVTLAKLEHGTGSNDGKFLRANNGADPTFETLDVGIADNKIVQIDDADAADDDYAKFTANGLEGRSYAEVKTDLSLNNVENTAISTFAGSSNITTVGAVATVTSTASGTPGVRKITTSTSAPSSGSDGDIWIKYTA
tara:strand:+ start:573 stop:1055 length:483 start_codon:yes stop_codon:yes gene_type:complete